MPLLAICIKKQLPKSIKGATYMLLCCPNSFLSLNCCSLPRGTPFSYSSRFYSFTCGSRSNYTLRHLCYRQAPVTTSFDLPRPVNYPWSLMTMKCGIVRLGYRHSPSSSSVTTDPSSSSSHRSMGLSLGPSRRLASSWGKGSS